VARGAPATKFDKGGGCVGKPVPGAIMRPMRRLTACTVAALVVAGMLVGSGAGAAGLERPQIQVTSATPMTVTGTRFHRHERVRVTMRSTPGMSMVRRTTAGARGRFTVRFRGFRMGRCGSMFTVVATGSMGSHAALAHRFVAQRACATM
jgi:hypothetical protein